MIAAARQLLERRVLQYVALYLGVAWGAVQFVNFLEERYGLTPHLTDIALLGFGLLLPSVVLFTYHHGRPGADQWQRSEKIAIPLNFIAAVAILFLVFGNKELSAVTQSITVQDEEGNTTTRVVPNASYRKRLALFNFDGPAGDSTLAWLRYALPIGIASDLNQDMFIDVRPSAFFREKLRQLGFQDELNIPGALKRQIAEEWHLPYYTDAKIGRDADQITVDLALYETARGTALKQRRLAHTDVFALIDQITVALKEDLGIPQLAQVKDLPVTEVTTSSLPAFRLYSDAIAALSLRDEWPRAAELLQQAVTHDGTFAAAHLALHNVYLLSNQSDRSMPPLELAMQHHYRLPERSQYDVRAEYHFMKQDVEKAFAAAKLKVDLFPEDISGYLLLSQFQLLRNDRDGQIASYQKIYELNPGQQELLREIGGLYEAKGDFENAARYYSQYAERFPARHDAATALARLYHLQGKHDAARQQYEKALVVAPGDMTAMLGLAAIERDAGAFERAERQLQDALGSAKTADERARALDGMSDYARFRGQLRRGIELAEQSLQESAKVQPPLAIALAQLRMTGDYVRAGMPDVAKRTYDRVSVQLQPPLHTIASLGEMELNLALEQLDQAEQAALTAEQRIQQFGLNHLVAAVVFGRARIAEQRGDCEAALQLYDRKLQLDPRDVAVNTYRAACYRKLGQAQRAIESAQLALKAAPFHARANYDLALAYIDAGDRTRALDHLRRAVQVWQNADATHRLAREAKTRLLQLEAPS